MFFSFFFIGVTAAKKMFKSTVLLSFIWFAGSIEISMFAFCRSVINENTHAWWKTALPQIYSGAKKARAVLLRQI